MPFCWFCHEAAKLATPRENLSTRLCDQGRHKLTCSAIKVIARAAAIKLSRERITKTLGVHCLPRHICPKTKDHYGNDQEPIQSNSTSCPEAVYGFKHGIHYCEMPYYAPIFFFFFFFWGGGVRRDYFGEL